MGGKKRTKRGHEVRRRGVDLKGIKRNGGGYDKSRLYAYIYMHI